MAISNSVIGLAGGLFVPALPAVTNIGVALSTTGAQTNTLPSTGVFNSNGQNYTFQKGMVRVRIYGAGGTNPTVTFKVTGTDGTNTVVLAPATATSAVLTASTDRVDTVIIFNVEELLNKVSVITTLGGTSPTASMDLEFVGCI